MGNYVFHPASDRQLCPFDKLVLSPTYPELATIFYSSVGGVILYVSLIGFVLHAKRVAIARADSSAAAAVVLPAYLPILFVGLVSACAQILVVLGYGVLCDSSYLDEKPWLAGINPLNSILFAVYVFSYEWFVNSLGVLFLLQSVSKHSLFRALVGGIGVALICAILSGVAIDYVRLGGALERSFEYLLLLCAQILPICLLLFIGCRRSTRSPAVPIVAHGLSWRFLHSIDCAYLLLAKPQLPSGSPSGSMVLVIQILRTTILPLVVYRLLLLDTWHWRGLLRRRRLDMDAVRQGVSDHPEAAGGIGRYLAQPRYPSSDAANDLLMRLLDTSADLIIDHAFLTVDYDSLLGRGSSASVFRGSLTVLWGARLFPSVFRISGGSVMLQQETTARTIEVAIKMYTPPELDETAILAINEEMSTWSEIAQLAFVESANALEREEPEDGIVVLDKFQPNIVRFFGMCVMPPHLSLVFEYCEGGTLENWIEEQTTSHLDCNIKLRILRDCASAVYFLHKHNYIHRDIKPANFLMKGGKALLTDFGTCIATRGSGNQQTLHLRGGQAVAFNNALVQGNTVGTIDYMAPELLGDSEESKMYSSASDIYALGVVLASVVAGQLPFPGLREWTIREKVLQGERPFYLNIPFYDKYEVVRTWNQDAFHDDPAKRSQIPPLIEYIHRALNSESGNGPNIGSDS